MYAVIESGGKQYRVEVGAELELDQLTATPGDTIDLGRVLLIADGDTAMIGRPVVDGARVTAEVLRAARGEKIIVFKYRPKARHRAKQGHRQDLTIVRIADIEFAGRSAAREAQAVAEEQAKAKADAARAAEKAAAADRALADKLARDQAEQAKKDEAAQADAKRAAGGPKTTAKAKPADGTAKSKAKAKAASDTAPKPSPKAGAKAAAKPASRTKPASKTRKDE